MWSIGSGAAVLYLFSSTMRRMVDHIDSQWEKLQEDPNVHGLPVLPCVEIIKVEDSPPPRAEDEGAELVDDNESVATTVVVDHNDVAQDVDLEGVDLQIEQDMGNGGNQGRRGEEMLAAMSESGDSDWGESGESEREVLEESQEQDGTLEGRGDTHEQDGNQEGRGDIQEHADTLLESTDEEEKEDNSYQDTVPNPAPCGGASSSGLGSGPAPPDAASSGGSGSGPAQPDAASSSGSGSRRPVVLFQTVLQELEDSDDNASLATRWHDKEKLKAEQEREQLEVLRMRRSEAAQRLAEADQAKKDRREKRADRIVGLKRKAEEQMGADVAARLFEGWHAWTAIGTAQLRQEIRQGMFATTRDMESRRTQIEKWVERQRIDVFHRVGYTLSVDGEWKKR